MFATYVKEHYLYTYLNIKVLEKNALFLFIGVNYLLRDRVVPADGSPTFRHQIFLHSSYLQYINILTDRHFEALTSCNFISPSKRDLKKVVFSKKKSKK